MAFSSKRKRNKAKDRIGKGFGAVLLCLIYSQIILLAFLTSLSVIYNIGFFFPHWLLLI